MPYVTSAERIGMRKGLEQGLQQGFLIEGREMILEELDRFGEVPSIISNVVNQIEDKDLLKSLLRCAIRCTSLEQFKQALNGRI